MPSGLTLFDARQSSTAGGRVVDLAYSDGLSVVSLFVQRGRLPAGGRITHAAPPGKPGSGRELLRDRRIWIFFAANALSMILYSLWFNWTTLYLAEVHRHIQRHAVEYIEGVECVDS